MDLASDTFLQYIFSMGKFSINRKPVEVMPSPHQKKKSWLLPFMNSIQSLVNNNVNISTKSCNSQIDKKQKVFYCVRQSFKNKTQEGTGYATQYLRNRTVECLDDETMTIFGFKKCLLRI